MQILVQTVHPNKVIDRMWFIQFEPKNPLAFPKFHKHNPLKGDPLEIAAIVELLAAVVRDILIVQENKRLQETLKNR